MYPEVSPSLHPYFCESSHLHAAYGFFCKGQNELLYRHMGRSVGLSHASVYAEGFSSTSGVLSRV